MNKAIQAYNDAQSNTEKEICNILSREINRNLPEATNKIWHAHPVWFLAGKSYCGLQQIEKLYSAFVLERTIFRGNTIEK